MLYSGSMYSAVVMHGFCQALADGWCWNEATVAGIFSCCCGAKAPACLMAPLDAYGHSVDLNPRLQLAPDGVVDSMLDNQVHLPTQLGFADAPAFPD
ncbi:hypothetical protein Nepgr_006641 [Nepenthes gracilis]|uniref:Uncharacterized protein n=1 Tax=Nepenthes gracilis TaxID=150966 RepID=A0AAD3XHS9_NEPGR|nr:hypothetical protein Nepgr_006641 [Nepenthes gracilis]